RSRPSLRSRPAAVLDFSALGECCRLASLSFSGLRPPRDLHSFPTRRSSDLLCSCRRDLDSRSLWGGRRSSLGRSGTHRGQLALRSEEHTSELQSRRELVCRLLLEKKKSYELPVALLRDESVLVKSRRQQHI